jgi:hypothetical protein
MRAKRSVCTALRIVWPFAKTTSSMSAQRCGGSNGSHWRQDRGPGVRSALYGLAGVGMGLPEAQEQLANLCRKCGIQRI